MLESINADIELSEYFLKVNVSSTGNKKLRIECIAKNYIVKVSFEHFNGLENRSEVFDRRNAEGIKTALLPDTNYFYPISYIPYHDFKHHLSAYEFATIDDQTKLWRFLSIENFIEVYSDFNPVIEMIMQDN